MSDNVWFPLLSSPDQLNEVLRKYLGTNQQPSHQFTDIYSLDDLSVLFPFDFAAILFLFPVVSSSENQSDLDAEYAEKSALNGNKVLDKPLFIRQYVDNACGSIAVLHAILNSTNSVVSSSLLNESQKEDLSPVQKLLRCKSAEERGHLIQQDSQFFQIHNSCINVDTEKSANEEDLSTTLHFVCFVTRGGQLFELDGRFAEPICHGKIETNLLEDTVKVVKKRIETTDSLEFTLIGLTETANL